MDLSDKVYMKKVYFHRINYLKIFFTGRKLQENTSFVYFTRHGQANGRILCHSHEVVMMLCFFLAIECDSVLSFQDYNVNVNVNVLSPLFS